MDGILASYWTKRKQISGGLFKFVCFRIRKVFNNTDHTGYSATSSVGRGIGGKAVGYCNKTEETTE